MDAVAYRLERSIREDAAFLTDIQSENLAARARMFAAIDAQRDNLQRQDVMRLEDLAMRLTRGHE